MKKLCKKCGELKEHKAHGLCRDCYQKVECSIIPGVGSGTKARTSIWTNGVTEELKPLIPKIKDKVLEDCIKNPRKYLEGIEMKVDKKFIEKEVKKLDPKLEKSEEAFKIATILLAGLKVGADTKKIAEFLKINEKDIKKYEKNLRDNQVWVKGKTQCNWFDKGDGGISFWLDVSIAQGHIRKVFKKK